MRSRGTEFDAAVEWCESVLAAAEGLALNVDRNASMHLLGHAALSMHQVFHPDKSAALKAEYRIRRMSARDKRAFCKAVLDRP